MPILRRSAGHKASDLGHEHNQGRLTHIGGFSGHVRAGDDGNPVISIVQIGVVGDEHIVAASFVPPPDDGRS